ncbi:synaptotagmin-16 isoform X2 [Nematostella vectensis]|uniref:synaptotagmin-16 isoform X2 n=1 Tax=Nematostella vectensis TaxID=45351 RepID=UPI00138FBFC8|nr:synaptotagmin-16 isoform X2 [Nematostella vectensis]
MAFGYVPAISFLALILLLLVGLLGMYYCLTHNLCPCTQTEADKVAYEELNIGEETDEAEDLARSPRPVKKTPQIASDSEVDGRTPSERVENASEVHSDTEVGSIRSASTARAGGVRGGEGGEEALLPGKAWIVAEYYPDVGRVGFSIVEAQNVPMKGKGGGTHARFHVVLLPAKKQRFKTKHRRTPHPKFRETFVFDRLVKEDLYRMAVRLRLYTQSGVAKEKLVGEINLQLADIAQAPGYKLNAWRDLRKARNPADP